MTETPPPQAEIEPITFTKKGDAMEARMSRDFEAAPDEVWTMLTQPASRVQWLAPGEIELKVGGSARLDFVDSGIVIDSQVSALEPGKVLEFSWSGPGEPLRPVGVDTTLLEDSAHFEADDGPQGSLFDDGIDDPDLDPGNDPGFDDDPDDLIDA